MFDLRKRILVTLALVVLTAALFFVFFPKNDAALTLAMLDVGQGDSFFIQMPTGERVIVDAGMDATTLAPLGRLMPWFARDIDLLVLTHPDLDHIGGASDILRRYRVREILMTGVLHGSAAYEDILLEIARQQIPVTIATSETDFSFGAVSFDALWPTDSRLATDPADNNESSIVIRLDYGKTSALLTGDATVAVEEALIAAGAPLRADILKLGHHGALTSSSQAFLDAVDPAIVLISAGENNRFGHPRPEVMARIAGKEIFETASAGTVTLKSDGMSWQTPVVARGFAFR